jgi:hypothetical protein
MADQKDWQKDEAHAPSGTTGDRATSGAGDSSGQGESDMDQESAGSNKLTNR